MGLLYELIQVADNTPLQKSGPQPGGGLTRPDLADENSMNGKTHEKS